jgi:phosphoribulokinase
MTAEYLRGGNMKGYKLFNSGSYITYLNFSSTGGAFQRQGSTAAPLTVKRLPVADRPVVVTHFPELEDDTNLNFHGTIKK